MLDDFALVVRIDNFLLHHAFAHRRHLRAVFRVHDGGNDVAAERRANLAELVFVELLHATDAHFEAVDFEFGTVGGKAAVHGAGNARAEVTANHRCTEQANLRLLFLEEVHHERCVRVGGVGEEPFGVEHMDLVHTVGEHLLFNSVEALACADAFELNAERVGELAALGQKFEGNIDNGRALNFAIYKYVIHRLANNLPV